MPPPRFAIWLRALRAPFVTASVVPVLAGAFAAYWRVGRLDPMRLALTLAGVGCLHLGANLANDYYDEITGCDRLNREPTPFSGGSRVIQAGLVPARSVIAAAVGFLATGLALGLWLNSMVPGNGVLVLGLAGLGCGLIYSASPLRLSYRGIGEIVIFLAFGPLVVAGSYLCQADRLTLFPFLVSVAPGLMVVAILLINEVLDLRWDREAGKRTLVVALGERWGYLLYLTVYLSAFGWVALGMVFRIYPAVAAPAFLPLVWSLKHLLPGRALADRQGTIKASGLTIASHAIGMGLLAVAYLVEGLI
jgi:1,4-dihydroxy-2-naphthoate octaprenyltransferase